MARGWTVMGLVAAWVGCAAEPESNAPPVEGACAEISFADPALAAAVRAQLGVAEDDEIDPNALAAATMLMIDDAGIADLSGIECAVSLEYLFARDNEIADVTPLAELAVLEHIHIDGNRVTDLSPLSGHPTLFTLKASNNLLTAVGVADLAALKNLDLSDNPITALELSGVGGLMSLRIERTQVSDLSALASTPSLDNVYANGAALTSLASVPNLGQLTFLYLADNAISDATCTASLPNLRALDLSGNQLASLEGLSPAAIGGTLALDRNPLEGLESITPLEMVRLSINEVGLADLAALADVPLVELSAGGNGLVDLTPIAHIPSLHVAGNAIVDLSPLVGHRFASLDLSNNQIVDASPLSEVDLDECGFVSLVGNPLQDEQTIVDQLCEANINVAEQCQPGACDPCGGAPDCG